MKTVITGAALGYSIFIARTAFFIDGRIHFTLFDDAMISMQYARHLADGNGLRWNAGEPPVEGFSNLLWTLLMAAFHQLGLPDAWAAVPPMLIGVLVLLGIIALTARLTGILAGPDSARASRVAAVLVATSYPLIFWTLRGMEVGLVALFTMLLLWALLDAQASPRTRWLVAAAATAAVTLTRDDGLVPVVAIGSTALIVSSPGRVRSLAILCATVLIATKAAHLGWRHAYYGDWVPNTYYLKLTGVSSVSRAWTGLVVWLSVVLRQVGPLLVPALLAAVALTRRGEPRPGSVLTRCGQPGPRIGDPRLLIVLAPFAAVSAYSVAVGGDAWEYFNFANRYLTAGLPPLCVLSGLLLARADGRGRALAVAGIGMAMIAGGVWDIAEKLALPYVAPGLIAWGVLMIGGGAAAILARRHRWVADGAVASTTCVLLIVGVSSGRLHARWLVGNAHALETDRVVTGLGVAIRETTDPRASVAAYLAGSTPYFARRRSIDLFGKSDPHVARLHTTTVHPGHNKVDLPYSLGLRPDVVVTFVEAPPDTRRQLEEHGYARLCPAVWARADSTLVDRDRLAGRCNQ